MKYCYCAVICRCGNQIVLKYLGPAGYDAYPVRLPPAFPHAFAMLCETCGESSTYAREDMTLIKLDEPPPIGFQDQF